MLKGFQVFNLDSEEMGKVSAEERFKLNLPEAGESLIQKLKAKGYGVLVNFSMDSGVPTSLIVVGKPGSLKEDFYSITESLGLRWFRSGEAYSETP